VSGKVVAVTGASGFLGQFVVYQLAELGHIPISLDRHLDGWDVRTDFIPKECGAVIHLAGMLGTSELFDHPLEAVSVNINGTINVLQQCESQGMSYVGITMPSVWANPYQATKRCARDLAAAWHQHRGVPVSHVRAFNVYGPWQKVKGVQKMVPTFAHHAWRDMPLPIWGDGTQQVDLVYAGDVARALVAMLKFGDDEVFDAGTGEGRSVLEVAHMVREITCTDPPNAHLPMRPGETPAKVTADGEGWDLLGWHPTFDADKFAVTVGYYRYDDLP
jgi:UDP-glucose 4-epimerase